MLTTKKKEPRKEMTNVVLDERKLRILSAIIDDYIETAAPIGSRTITRRHDIGVSPPRSATR